MYPIIKFGAVLAASAFLQRRMRKRSSALTASHQSRDVMESAPCSSQQGEQLPTPCEVPGLLPLAAEPCGEEFVPAASCTSAQILASGVPEQGVRAIRDIRSHPLAEFELPAAAVSSSSGDMAACNCRLAPVGPSSGPHVLGAPCELQACACCFSPAADMLIAAARSPMASPARPPCSPEPASAHQRPLLPTPPPEGAAGLRAIRRTVSAPAARCPGGNDGCTSPPASPRLSVHARAAKFEAGCGATEGSPCWSSPAVSRSRSSCRVSPTSAAESCWSGYSSSGSTSSSGGWDSDSSPGSSAHTSPRTSCHGGSGGRGSWGRSSSCRGSTGGDGVSFLPFARASQHGAFGSPSKPNMPRIQGL